MKEQDYQKKIVKYLESKGAYVVKVITASKKGVPDVLACYKGRFIAIEVKTPTTMNNASELQKYNLEKIRDAGGVAMISCEASDLDYTLKRIDDEHD